MTMISVQDLYKSYGNNQVLKGVSFEVGQGEIFAILGTNGAGKTTLLECIEGLMPYNGGNIDIDKKVIGVQLQSGSLPDNIKVGEAVKLFSLWNKAGTTNQPVGFGLEKIFKKQYQELSTGQKRRLHLALAMVNDPEIVFLDEPTAGLDVEARADLHEEIRNLKKQGKTLVLASHDMAEVENLCDRMIMLKGGKIVFLGSVEDFTAQNARKFKIHIKVKVGGEFAVTEVENINHGLMEILKQNESIVDIKIERPTLEESFLAVAKDELSIHKELNIK